MRKSKLLLAGAAVLTAVAAFAAVNVKEQLDALQKERDQLELEMHKVRIELIKSDPALTRLHQRIMAMHKELAIQVDRKPEMSKLYSKAAKFDVELEKLRKEVEKQGKEAPSK